jgi:hypothetical protein
MDKVMGINFTGLVYFSYHIQEHLKKANGRYFISNIK